MEIRGLVAGAAEALVALFAAVLPGSPAAHIDRLDEHNETAQALYESLRGDRKPLGDVNFWWDLA